MAQHRSECSILFGGVPLISKPSRSALGPAALQPRRRGLLGLSHDCRPPVEGGRKLLGGGAGGGLGGVSGFGPQHMKYMGIKMISATWVSF